MRNNKVVREYTGARGRPAGWRKPSDVPTRLLEQIRQAEKRGDPMPTIRELQRQCGISTTSIVEYHMHRLANDGDIILGPKGASRAYRLTPQGRGYPDDTEMLEQALEALTSGVVARSLLDDLRRRLG